MSQVVQELVRRIEQLPEADRLMLDEYFARRSEAEWQREAGEARRIAARQGMDQAAIDAAVERARHDISPWTDEDRVAFRAEAVETLGWDGMDAYQGDGP